MLARVRRALRALNSAIGRGAEAAELTLQQQAFLLAVVAYGGRDVPLADVREELEMDQATTSELLRRLVSARLVARGAAPDRRALRVGLTGHGWDVFRRSVISIRDEVRRADHRGELGALGSELQRYLGFYLKGNVRRRTTRHATRHPRRERRRSRSAL
jgi:DNA-binding MarR family transcriptional regulator